MGETNDLNLQKDTERGKELAKILIPAFSNEGIYGHKDMPEDAVPEGVEKGSREHILFITMTVAIDYQRDAYDLWNGARKTYNNPETRYLFDPDSFSEDMMDGEKFEKVINDMQKYRLSKKQNKDAKNWITIALSLKRKCGSNPENIFRDNNWDAVKILNYIKNEKKHEGKGHAFPYLRGGKIGPLWIRMLRDNAGLKELKNLENIPIPVDVHVTRATLACGVVYGHDENFHLEKLHKLIRDVWKESTDGLYINGKKIMPIDVDEALWNLSRYGCTLRNKKTGDCPIIKCCVAGSMCVKGTIDLYDEEKCNIDIKI